MARKGWSSLETPAGWYQVIRGPRPKAVQWPRRQWWSSSSWWQQGGQWPELKSQKPQKPQVQRRWQRGQPTRYESAAAAERHRRVGRQRVSRSSVVGSSTRGSPPSSSGATCGDPSRRMSGFPPTFSKSVGSAGARGGSRTEGDGNCPGSVDQIAEEMMRAPSPQPTQPAATPVQPDPNLAEVQQLRARIAEREEFRKKRAMSLHRTCPGRRSKAWLSFSVRQETDLL